MEERIPLTASTPKVASKRSSVTESRGTRVEKGGERDVSASRLLSPLVERKGVGKVDDGEVGGVEGGVTVEKKLSIAEM